MTALWLNTSARKIGDEAMKNHWRKTPKRWQRIQPTKCPLRRKQKKHYAVELSICVYNVLTTFAMRSKPSIIRLRGQAMFMRRCCIDCGS